MAPIKEGKDSQPVDRSPLYDDLFRINRQVEIPLSTMPVYECGAILLAYLAFPNPADAAQRERMEVAFCNLVFKIKNRLDPEWSRTRQSIKPEHLMITEVETAKLFKLFARRFQDRVTAAAIFGAFLLQSMDLLPKLPNGARLTISYMVERVAFLSRERDPKNIEFRVWKRSLPVIHLASAAVATLTDKAQLQDLDQKPIGFAYLLVASMTDPNFISGLLQVAEESALLVMTMDKFRRDAHRLVRFRAA